MDEKIITNDFSEIKNEKQKGTKIKSQEYSDLSVIKSVLVFFGTCVLIYFIWIKFATFEFVRNGSFFWFFSAKKEILTLLGIFIFSITTCLVVILKKNIINIPTFKMPNIKKRIFSSKKGVVSFSIGLLVWLGYIRLWLDLVLGVPREYRGGAGQGMVMLFSFLEYVFPMSLICFTGLIIGVWSCYQGWVNFHRFYTVDVLGCFLTSIFLLFVIISVLPLF